MAARVAPSTWIPEDDLLLKTAVEAGASLEALAKGAVRFSRKFTVSELQDRWHSLLYDPIISGEASARMVELELSASNNASRSVSSAASSDNAKVPQKRRVDSVRTLYYALRKRTCSWPVKSPNLSPQIPQKASNKTEDVRHHDDMVENFMLGDCIENHFDFHNMDVDISRNELEDILIKDVIKHEVSEQEDLSEDLSHITERTFVDFIECPGVEATGASRALPQSGASIHSLGYVSPQPRTPLWETIEDISAPAMPINISDKAKVQYPEKTFIIPGDIDNKRTSASAIPESDLACLSDSLLNLEHKDERNFMDRDSKDTIPKSCHVSTKQILLDSPSDVLKGVAHHVKKPETSQAIPDSTCDTKLWFPAGKSESSPGKQDNIASSEVALPPSTLTANPPSDETLYREMICMLNSEDPEIPCNDYFPLGKMMATSVLKASSKKDSATTSSFVTRADSGEKLSMTKKGKSPTQSFTASKMGASDAFARTPYDPLLFTSGDKSEASDVELHAGVSKSANNSNAGQCKYIETPKAVTHAGLKEASMHACNAVDVTVQGKSGSATNYIPKTEANLSTLDEDASPNREECDNDDDLPFFSDIESLILDMDLYPDDQDSGFSREVSSYQPEDIKRTIIRLEQCARSSTQREMAHRGALAIFYGRHFKYYIKKTEVVLGRATDDFDVDIDLRREGCANKISRQQALIKTKEDGSFFLKNLGRISMFLNGEEICTGQSQKLSSSSLIEVRGMAFVFEINPRSVKQYLGNLARSNPGKKTPFEWSEEGVR